ncbi:hypothetical protein NEOC95_000177 [Neochlamydia sp. AcF95]|nr:hypothetical protein [Neochlamydia sp. AcF95]
MQSAFSKLKKDYKAIYPFTDSVGFSYLCKNQAFNQRA